MLPLLFMTDRKAMYFDDKELSLYETCFQPFGVEPKVNKGEVHGACTVRRGCCCGRVLCGNLLLFSRNGTS